jgi:hypothetical protein
VRQHVAHAREAGDLVAVQPVGGDDAGDATHD